MAKKSWTYSILPNIKFKYSWVNMLRYQSFERCNDFQNASWDGCNFVDFQEEMVWKEAMKTPIN